MGESPTLSKDSSDITGTIDASANKEKHEANPAVTEGNPVTTSASSEHEAVTSLPRSEGPGTLNMDPTLAVQLLRMLTDSAARATAPLATAPLATLQATSTEASKTQDEYEDISEPEGSDWAEDVQALLAPSESGVENDSEQDDPLALAIGMYSQEEELGPDLPEMAASLANRALRKPIPADREKELADKVIRPANVTGLVVPRVNPEVWKGMGRRTKETDLNYQRIQNFLHKGLTPILRLLAQLREKKLMEEVRMTLDGFQLLAIASLTITNLRKASIAQDVVPQYKPLCSAQRPATDLLFGDEEDFAKTTKQLMEANATRDQTHIYIAEGAPERPWIQTARNGERGID